jgi:hypothetical protein
MFTTGSKYFLGLTALSAVAAVIYMIVVNPSDLGSVALISLVAASGLVSGLVLFTRDATVASADAAHAAKAGPESAGPWPIVTALGVAVMLLGVATIQQVLIVGAAVALLGAAEWLVVDWADKASADGAFNRFVRSRALSAIELPVFAAIGAGLIAVSFSRIMLAVSKSGGAVLFIVISAAILVVGFLVAFKPAFRGKVVTVLSGLAAVALLAAGVVSATSGEREDLVKAAEEGHFTHKSIEDCGPEKSKYFDKHPNSAVSMRAGVIATVILEDGRLSAIEIGIDEPTNRITVARANHVSILFRNKDAEDRRLFASLGETVSNVNGTDITEPLFDCTQLTGKNQEQVLVVRIDTPTTATDRYTLTVPGVEGTEIEMVVP